MIRSYALGDGCRCWSFADEIEETVVKRTLHIYRMLKNLPLADDIYDLVPSYKSIAIHLDPAGEQEKIWAEAGRFIEKEWDKMEKAGTVPPLPGKELILPVVYDGEDLPLVAAHCGLDAKDVIRLHTEGRYIVAMLGFKPHFPYLLGLDSRLETPRLDTPRTRIPAGAVAIGGAQTGVYPEESPGGWNLIGRTDPELLKQAEPGDTIIMKEVKE